MSIPPRAFLQSLFRTAVAAAHPATCLPPLLPPPPARPAHPARRRQGGGLDGRSGGRRLSRPARACPRARLTGVAVARHGYGRPPRAVTMIEAGHPIPDARGARSRRARARARRRRGRRRPGAGADVGRRLRQLDRAGGRPLFADKQAVTRALLRSGATIGEINTVRKHLSRIKGGRLARHALSGAARHHRDLRRAGRRSVRDRLGADGARSDHACRRARHRRQIPARSCRPA